METERKVWDAVPGNMAGAQPEWAALQARWLAGCEVRRALASATCDTARGVLQSASFDAGGARALSALGLSLTEVNPTVSAIGKPGLGLVGAAAIAVSMDGRGSK